MQGKLVTLIENITSLEDKIKDQNNQINQRDSEIEQ